MKMDTYVFVQNGYTLRVTDLRPEQQAIQINVYNPEDAGHALASFLGIQVGVDMTAEQFANSLDPILIDTYIQKAQRHFDALKQIETN